MVNIILNVMEIIWRTVVSTLMLFFFSRYFYNPPTPPSPFLIFFFLGLIIFLFIIDRNRSVYQETEDFYVTYTLEEYKMLDDYINTTDKNKDCCNLTRYYYYDEDDCFSFYGGFQEVDHNGGIWNDDDDYSQWNQDDGVENHDGHDDDDDNLTSRIEDYIASVYNGWREERRAEKFV
ncbi:unnamed protein product [Microthlaspi erraticum]|uniref:Uncharacterized protein n=1 Tax=Microthlaspi erraticum TaxID=1685480 RepID=A0A6D2J2V0_9BRAS|nr:unnamed protein product [Microthlaspi erraticum]